MLLELDREAHAPMQVDGVGQAGRSSSSVGVVDSRRGKAVKVRMAIGRMFGVTIFCNTDSSPAHPST